MKEPTQPSRQLDRDHPAAVEREYLDNGHGVRSACRCDAVYPRKLRVDPVGSATIIRSALIIAVELGHVCQRDNELFPPSNPNNTNGVGTQTVPLSDEVTDYSPVKVPSACAPGPSSELVWIEHWPAGDLYHRVAHFPHQTKRF